MNVADSDGTLLFSHGLLKGGSALTRRLAKKHNKPCLHIDLNDVTLDRTVEIIRSWIDTREIKTLNVAGPRESEDPLIYDDVKAVLSSLLYPPPEHITPGFPKTLNEAVERLMSTMPMKEKSVMAKTEENRLASLSPALRRYIGDNFGLFSGNKELLQSCRYMAKKYELSGEEACMLIIKELWRRLRETHILRVIK